MQGQLKKNIDRKRRKMRKKESSMIRFSHELKKNAEEPQMQERCKGTWKLNS
jgi:hypothetical protein